LTNKKEKKGRVVRGLSEDNRNPGFSTQKGEGTFKKKGPTLGETDPAQTDVVGWVRNV